MLYKITVFRELGNKRKKIYNMEISAREVNIAFERACIRMAPDRIVEIRQVEVDCQRDRFERPQRAKPNPDLIPPTYHVVTEGYDPSKIKRVERDGT